MKFLKTAILISIPLILGGIDNQCHSMEFRSDMVGEMSTLLNIGQPGPDTLMTMRHGGRDVSVRLSDNCVEHIGYRIFSEIQRKGLNRNIADFVERYWLSVTLPMKRKKSVGQQMKEDRFIFLKGSPESVDIIQHDCNLPFYCELSPKEVSMTWGNPGSPVCRIKFPVNHELILGRKMLENDRRLPGEINRAYPGVLKREEQPIGSQDSEDAAISSVRVEQHGAYLDCSLKSERYYDRNWAGECYLPIFDISRPMESIMNLFTGDDIAEADEIGIDIRHKTFGLREQIIRTTVRKFVSYALKEGCVPYVGIVSMDHSVSGEADLLVIMRNREIGYNHVLRVSLPLSCLKDGHGTSTARLNAFVPSSNINDLFKN